MCLLYSMLKNLQTQYSTEMQLNKSILQNSEIQIHKLRDEIAVIKFDIHSLLSFKYWICDYFDFHFKDKDWNCKITKQYVTGWQNAKIDQHKLRNSQAEQVLSNELNETKTKIEHETMINQEIEKFIRMRMQV